ncbi:MAG: 2'-5' RNA ligase family protein, partial [Candidatus Njordarchaeota archaeon]
TFHPHITIARVKRYTSDLKQIMKSLEDTDIGPFIVKSVKLKKSTLTSRGPIYEDLSIINLG